MLCALILYVSGWTYSLTSTSNNKFFFETFFHGKFYLLPEFLLENCWEEIAEEIFFIFFIFRFDVEYQVGLGGDYELCMNLKLKFSN